MTLKEHSIRFYKATIYSLQGVAAIWQREAGFRLEAYIFILLLPLIHHLNQPNFTKLVLILLLLLVMVVELLNTAIEATVNRISLEYHPESKVAKDAGSAAVAFVFFMNIVAWVYILFF